MPGVGWQCLTFSGWHFRDTGGIMGPWLPKAVLGCGRVFVLRACLDRVAQRCHWEARAQNAVTERPQVQPSGFFL